MYVRDYDLILNFKELFNKHIVVYGAGNFGKNTYQLLCSINLEVDCFCDGKKNISTYMGRPVITMKELKTKTKKENCLIIVACFKEFDDIIKKLQVSGIEAYICTWYGVQCAIELNCTDECLPINFRKSFSNRLEISKMNCQFSYLLSTYEQIAMSYNPILIYQPAKVGSSTIRDSLNLRGVENVHFHYLMDNGVKTSDMPKEVVSMLDKYAEYARNNIAKAEKIKIITLVREPISRAVSWFMEWFYLKCIVRKTDYRIDIAMNEFVENQLKSNYEFEWFDREIKAFTGIDIFQYPFDKEQGYAWIKEGNVEILVLKLETLGQNKKNISDFVGISDIEFYRTNVGEYKHYKYIYEKIKQELKLSDEILNTYYFENEKLNHFYTNAEKNAAIDKWNLN